MSSEFMRKLMRLLEGDVVQFTGNTQPVSNMARAMGGADVHKMERPTDMANFDRFTQGYIEAALWSSHDESTDSGGEPMDANYGPEDIAQETAAEMAKDCADFQQRYEALISQSGLSDSSAGHDFWLTRNGHGGGYWDRGLGDVGDELTEACKNYGSYDLYIGDDDRIHGS